MMKSMTGFGRCEHVTKEYRLMVEIKAVNHRYLDVNLRMPKKLMFLDSAIRNFLKHYIQRGKVDLFISYENYLERSASIRYNQKLAAEYVNYIRQMAADFGLEAEVNGYRLARFPDVLTMEEQTMDEAQLWEAVQEVLAGACERLVASRVEEGENLKQDLAKKLSVIAGLSEQIEERAPQILKEYQERLRTKVAELLGSVKLDEGRLATEITIFADRICTDEELVRLKSHVKSMTETMEQGDGVGRKLDFIAQEMNREANTILSKSNDLAASQIAIDLKTEIEKVREQIQNIE